MPPIAANASGRPVKYIALPPLLGSVVFQDVKEYKANPEAVRLVSHLGGHPRSFQLLRSVLERFKGASYDMLFGLLYDDMVARDETARDTPPELIADCLLGREVDYYGTVGGKPYSYYVEQARLYRVSYVMPCVFDSLNDCGKL